MQTMRPGLAYVIVALAVLLHLALAVRVIGAAPYPDEDISAGISRRLWTERTLDTNWRNVPQIAREYPADQFNFSSAILAAQPIGALVWATSGRYKPWDIAPLRLASSIYTLAAFVLFFLAFRRLFGIDAATLGLLLTVASAQLFLDSLYARPEGFVLFCFAAALYAVVRGADSARRGSWLAAAPLTEKNADGIRCKSSQWARTNRSTDFRCLPPMIDEPITTPSNPSSVNVGRTRSASSTVTLTPSSANASRIRAAIFAVCPYLLPYMMATWRVIRPPVQQYSATRASADAGVIFRTNQSAASCETSVSSSPAFAN